MPGISTFDSTKELLPDLLKSIREGKTQLPDFQRGWIWDDDHIKSLPAWIEHALGKPIAQEAVPEPPEAVADYQDEEEEAS